MNLIMHQVAKIESLAIAVYEIEYYCLAQSHYNVPVFVS